MPSTQFDDRDPSITYSPGWSTHEGSNEYKITVSLTRVAGSTARIKFTGSSIAVYGTVSSTAVSGSGTVSQYVLDSSSPVEYTTKPTSNNQYSALFYQSPTLVDGDHTLVISLETQNGWYWLDYLAVDRPTPVANPIEQHTITIDEQQETTTTTTSIATTTTAIATTTTTTKAASPTNGLSNSTSILPPTNSTDSSSNSNSTSIIQSPDNNSISNSTTEDSGALPNSDSAHSNEPPVGAIVGGVVGGLLVLFILISIIWWLRRKRTKSHIDSARVVTPTSIPKNQSRGPQKITPFELTAIPSQDMTQSQSYPFSAGPSYSGASDSQQIHAYQPPGSRPTTKAQMVQEQVRSSAAALSNGSNSDIPINSNSNVSECGISGASDNAYGSSSARSDVPSVRHRPTPSEDYPPAYSGPPSGVAFQVSGKQRVHSRWL